MKSFIRFHLPAILWALLIFILSSQSRLKPPDLGFTAADKVAHIIEYGIFGWLLLRSFSRLFLTNHKIFSVVFIAGTLYASSDEIHQLFVPGRLGTIGDFLADTVGILLSIIIYFMIHRRKTLKDT